MVAGPSASAEASPLSVFLRFLSGLPLILAAAVVQRCTVLIHSIQGHIRHCYALALRFFVQNRCTSSDPVRCPKIASTRAWVAHASAHQRDPLAATAYTRLGAYIIRKWLQRAVYGCLLSTIVRLKLTFGQGILSSCEGRRPLAPSPHTSIRTPPGNNGRVWGPIVHKTRRPLPDLRFIPSLRFEIPHALLRLRVKGAR